jgi:hypothetical protein
VLELAVRTGAIRRRPTAAPVRCGCKSKPASGPRPEKPLEDKLAARRCVDTELAAQPIRRQVVLTRRRAAWISTVGADVRASTGGWRGIHPKTVLHKVPGGELSVRLRAAPAWPGRGQ